MFAGPKTHKDPKDRRAFAPAVSQIIRAHLATSRFQRQPAISFFFLLFNPVFSSSSLSARGDGLHMITERLRDARQAMAGSPWGPGASHAPFCKTPNKCPTVLRLGGHLLGRSGDMGFAGPPGQTPGGLSDPSALWAPQITKHLRIARRS